MYCITYYDFTTKYLGYMPDDELLRGYMFINNKKDFLVNLVQHTKDHPLLFKTRKEAYEMIDKLAAFGTIRYKKDAFPQWIESTDMYKCDMNCWACNKKGQRKHHCKYLKNPYQNYCGFRMMKVPESYVPDKKRLDAPCEICESKFCPYNMNIGI